MQTPARSRSRVCGTSCPRTCTQILLRNDGARLSRLGAARSEGGPTAGEGGRKAPGRMA
jgi:hypothetical protein